MLSEEFLTCSLLLSSVMCVKDIYILGLFPMDGSWPGGYSIKTAAEIALEHVNEREDMLPGYKLNLIWNNTHCNAGAGVDAMYRNFYDPPTKIIVYGAGCSLVSEATAQASHRWNLVQMSWGSASPVLSDKTIYPRFFRGNSPDINMNPVRMALFQKFGWEKIATLHQSLQLFSVPTDDLISKIKADGREVLRSEIITGDPATQVKNLKQYDARIILGSFYTPVARKVFCEAYKVGLYGPRIVWILHGWHEKDWWTFEDDSIDCTASQLAEVAEGYFGVSRVYLNPKPEVGISGIRPEDFVALFDNRTNHKKPYGFRQSPLSYDSIWAISLALNSTLTELKESSNTTYLEDFSYTDDTVGSVILDKMKKVNFLGIMGQMSFNEKGDPIADLKIQRLQSGEMHTVGLYDPLSKGKIEWLTEKFPIVWKGGRVPKASMTVSKTAESLSFPLYITVCCVSGLGMCLTVFFLIFNIHFRDTRVVKMSSPKINNITLAGCLLLYASPFLDSESPEYQSKLCQAKIFLLTLGFSLAFGALFAKTWRVHVIFTNSTKQRKILKDEQLYWMIAALVGINTTVLLAWTFADPLKVVVHDRSPVINVEDDVETRSHVDTCESPNQVYFLGTLFTIQGILMLLGTFLAWETRKVNVTGLNDSKMIGISVYNVVVLSFLGVTVAMALRLQINLTYALTSVTIIAATTVTQCLIFVPKISAYRMNRIDDIGENGTMVNNGRVNTMVSTSAAVTANRLIALEKTLFQKEQLIEDLKRQLKGVTPNTIKEEKGY